MTHPESEQPPITEPILPIPDVKEAIDYKDRSILVLGGSSGIGLKAVAEFVRLGAENVYLGTSKLENFAAATRYLERREKIEVADVIKPFCADVTNKAQLAAAATEIRRSGPAITEVIFSQAGGMESFIERMFAKHIDPIVDDYTFATPIEELSDDDRKEVENRLAALRSDLTEWTQEALPHAMRVNYQGTFDAVDVLAETFPNGFTGIFYNSTWGHLSGQPGIAIPLMYRPVDISKANVRDRLMQEAPMLAEHGIYMAELVASLVTDTKVGKMFQDFFYNLMEKDQRQSVSSSAITTADVVLATRMLLASDPKTWSAYPNVSYVYKRAGDIVVGEHLDMSAMYTIPYAF